jgi:hypothetical protein
VASAGVVLQGLLLVLMLRSPARSAVTTGLLLPLLQAALPGVLLSVLPTLLLLKQPLLSLLLLLLPMTGVPGQLYSPLSVLLMLGMGVRGAGVALPSALMLWRLLQGTLLLLTAAADSSAPKLLCLLKPAPLGLLLLLLQLSPLLFSCALATCGGVGVQLGLLLMLQGLLMLKRPMPLPLLLKNVAWEPR